MFKQIDENYPRKEHFHHYMTVTRCTYSLVIDLDITKLYAILKEKRLKVYPVQIYLLARAVQKITGISDGSSERCTWLLGDSPS